MRLAQRCSHAHQSAYPRWSIGRFAKVEDIDSIAKVKTKLEDVKGVMTENIDLALRNLDKASQVEESSAALKDSALAFKKRAASVERTMIARYWKMILMISLLVIIVAAAIIVPVVMSQLPSGK